MATKDGNLYFKDKQNGFVDSISDYQYSNLNKSSNCLNFGRDFKENDDIKKVKGINNSTLSLNIAAYENSIESDAIDSEGIKGKSLKVKDAKTGLNKKWGISNHFGSESIIHNPFEFPRQQDDQDGRPEMMQFRASKRLRNPNRMDLNNGGQRLWQIDTFWPLKVLSFFGIAAYNSCVLSPADICFNLRHSALLEEKIKSNEFVLEPSQTYIIKERYCIMIDIFKHQLCSTQNLTTVPNDLCLAQSREVTTMFSQLFLAIFIDFFHMIVLYRGIQHLTPTQLAIPVVQISI
uniref:Uncharacterized protein n=1 Tax=Panagrolaimus sp. ES5 TaxID=591445 RepID=A0AC34FUF2_9BILA